VPRLKHACATAKREAEQPNYVENQNSLAGVSHVNLLYASYALMRLVCLWSAP